MAYTKNTWADGDIVTSEKLNHMEGGIENAGGVMVVNLNNETTLDKTWQEIYDAMDRGEFCFVRSAGSTGITFIYISEVGSDTTYYVSTTDDSTYVSATSDGYPSFDNES